MNTEVAVVVGAAGAIGSVITEQLVDAGLLVVAVGRDADKLQQLEGIAWEVRQATLRTNNTGTACKGITCGGR